MQLLHVDNYTPFEWFAFEKMGPGKRMYDVVIVKAAYSLSLIGQRYELAPLPKGELPVIHMADEPYERNGSAYASLRFAGDVVLYKPATDFFITGYATPPDTLATSWAAEIIVQANGKEHMQRMVFHGKRYWQWTLLKGWSLSKPQLTDKVALRYELSYGGSFPKDDHWERYTSNPVGEGYFPVQRMDRDVYYPAAQIELASDPLRAVDRSIRVPALGPIARTWVARKQFAGTYDSKWKEELRRSQTADYPADFNPKFFQAAHPEWNFSPFMQGNERIEAAGLTGSHLLVAKLPGCQLFLSGQSDQGQLHSQRMNLDTVELNLETKRLSVVWRLTMDQAMKLSAARIDHLQDAAALVGQKR